MKKILVVCAHPDDETLGLGGTLVLHKNKKDKIFVLFLSEGESARGKSNKKIVVRKNHAKKACAILGVQKIKFLDYPDQKLDSIPLVELTKKIENVISEWKPDIVYTHYWGDINQDHRQTFEATSIAVRPLPKSSIVEFICFETPSSTEWGMKSDVFNPNYFVNIESTLKKKLQALKEYKNEIRVKPHPRSIESTKNRATYWGNSVGLNFVEAFIIVNKISGK